MTVRQMPLVRAKATGSATQVVDEEYGRAPIADGGLCCLLDARDARGQPRTPQSALVAERVRRQDVEWKWTG